MSSAVDMVHPGTTWLESQCATLPAPDAVVMIGGDTSVAESFARWYPTCRLIVVEPWAEAIAAMRRAIGDDRACEFVQAVLADEDGEGDLRLMNVPAYSGMYSPEATDGRTPGLTPIARVRVESLTLPSLVDRCALSGSGRINWIVLGAPACAVLDNAENAGALPRAFGRVFLDTPYAAADVDALSALASGITELAALGFRQRGQVDDSRPTRPRVHLELSDTEQPASRLEERLLQAFTQGRGLDARNPYAHARTLTVENRQAVLNFARQCLGLEDLLPAYIDYLAMKAITIERLCHGRIATTLQDAVIRLLVVECLPGSDARILEIGSLYGVNLALLYNHAAARLTTTTVTALDPLDGYYGKARDALFNQPVDPQTFKRNMRIAAIPDSDWKLLRHYSTDEEALIAVRSQPLNLLVIDGDHSYDGVKFDFDNYFPCIEAGGYVIIDDYGVPEWPDVQRFVDEELMARPDFEFLGAQSRTAIGRRRTELHDNDVDEESEG
jgi:hypothetical protein